MFSSLNGRCVRAAAIVALAAATMLAGGPGQQSAAETAGQRSTRNIILAATAVTLVYLSNDGIHLCAYYGAGVRCGSRAEGHPWRYEDEDEWHGEGLHKGWYKGHGNKHHDNDQGEDH